MILIVRILIFTFLLTVAAAQSLFAAAATAEVVTCRYKNVEFSNPLVIYERFLKKVPFSYGLDKGTNFRDVVLNRIQSSFRPFDARLAERLKAVTDEKIVLENFSSAEKKPNYPFEAQENCEHFVAAMRLADGRIAVDQKVWQEWGLNYANKGVLISHVLINEMFLEWGQAEPIASRFFTLNLLDSQIDIEEDFLPLYKTANYNAKKFVPFQFDEFLFFEDPGIVESKTRIDDNANPLKVVNPDHYFTGETAFFGRIVKFNKRPMGDLPRSHIVDFKKHMGVDSFFPVVGNGTIELYDKVDFKEAVISDIAYLFKNARGSILLGERSIKLQPPILAWRTFNDLRLPQGNFGEKVILKIPKLNLTIPLQNFRFSVDEHSKRMSFSIYDAAIIPKTYNGRAVKGLHLEFSQDAKTLQVILTNTLGDYNHLLKESVPFVLE